MERRHRWLVAASCSIWLLTAVALVSCQNAPDVAGLRSLATAGDAAAQFDLGDRHFNGEGLPQDNGEAIRWFHLAAEQGHSRAQASLGFMYFNGEGVPQDDGEAARWYHLAADQGYAEAQFSLGVMYRNGRGAPQDDGEALRWYRLAADQGHAGAHFNLGLMYANGRGILKDDGEAARWFRLAADQGHAEAQYTLGLMYGAGRGVPQDYVAAHEWANLAAAQGHENARAMRDTFAEAMSATQRAARETRPSRSEPEDDLTDSFSGRSPKCGPVIGKTQQDLRNVEEFCSVGIPAGAVEGAYAMGSLLWIKITRPMADQLRAANSLDAESLVRNWMRGWKQLSKSKAVTVTIEWRDIEIAKGETTLLSGDKVTIHR